VRRVEQRRARVEEERVVQRRVVEALELRLAPERFAELELVKR
jgi:hypothetical protein